MKLVAIRAVQVLIGLTATVVSSTAFAENGLTPEQKSEYARVFRARGASPEELRTLRALQETRRAVPLSLKALQEFMGKSPEMQALEQGQTPQLGDILLWNGVALDATSLDHTTDTPQMPPSTFAEQFGPTRSSRALAITHLAVFEAVNLITKKYSSYGGIQATVLNRLNIPVDQISESKASIRRAIAESAFQTLSALHPNKRQIFKEVLDQTVVKIGDSAEAKELGRLIGLHAADAVLELRKFDGATRPDLKADDLKGNRGLDWGKDPITLLPIALGGNWSHVKPFVLDKAEKYRPAPPPEEKDPRFIAAFKGVKQLGGDPDAPVFGARRATQTDRVGKANQQPLDGTNETFKAIFWAYDGTPSLCAPPRLYNMVATSVALKEKPITTVEDMARYLALINIAMADAGIAAWEAKYYYLHARPVTAIRAVDADGTPAGKRDDRWTPLGAPVSNGEADVRNLTPPFPAYPSGHATFGGAVFQIMRDYWKLDVKGVPFEFVSDEYNGLNRGPGESIARPHVVRAFKSFEEAEIENAQSRVWLGIHWQYDADAGIVQGRQVADDVFANILRPVN